MKIGLRTPSLNKSIKARTSGRINRTIKKSIIPFYGKKKTGFIKNPKRATYNKIYSITTISAFTLLGLVIGGLFYIIFYLF